LEKYVRKASEHGEKEAHNREEKHDLYECDKEKGRTFFPGGTEGGIWKTESVESAGLSLGFQRKAP